MSPERKLFSTPIRLVVAMIGSVMLVTSFGIVVLAFLGMAQGCTPVEIPAPLPSIALASMTGLAGLLAPTHQLMPGSAPTHRAERRMEHAGQAAAAAVLEHEQLQDLATEAERMTNGDDK